MPAAGCIGVKETSKFKQGKLKIYPKILVCLFQILSHVIYERAWWSLSVVNLGNFDHLFRNFKFVYKTFPQVDWNMCRQNLQTCNYVRPWDYPQNLGIYSQLDRKSKTWFFTFLNVYVSWIERDKILISQFLPSKFRYFADKNRPNGTPHENKFWQISIAKTNCFQNS